MYWEMLGARRCRAGLWGWGGTCFFLNSSQEATWAESVAMQQETVPGSRTRNRRVPWACLRRTGRVGLHDGDGSLQEAGQKPRCLKILHF